MATALEAFLAEAPESQLVIDGSEPVEPGKYERVAVTARDRGDLRALTIPGGVRTAAIAVWLDQGSAALSLTVRPEWPALLLIRSRQVDGGWLTVLRFEARVPVHAVVGELARQSVWPDRVGERGLVVQWPGAPERAKVPPDVLMSDWHTHLDDEETVTARPPLLVSDRERPLGPIDERVLNPSGFDPAADGAVVELETLDWPWATEEMVRRLRPAAGVRLDRSWATAEVPGDLIAGLAIAGVPLVADEVPEELARRLGPAVASAIASPVDLTDPLAREEHSVVLRRAAMEEFSSFAWRRKLGEQAGVRVRHQPAVSVVMATRRPEMLEHALAQVAGQRGVDQLELVLAPHGFEPEPARLEAAAPELSIQVVPQPESAMFGDVLQAAALRTGGDVVLKMDDDDWYAPEFVLDLLHARAYSGAELVGTPDDYYYLEARDLTVRLGQPSEVYRQFVAGGTMLLDRTLLQEVGGFRSVRRHVDAQLIHAVRAAGGAIYRGHGLGYCLRRTTTGHTWETDLDDLEARAASTWRAFRPSRLLGL